MIIMGVDPGSYITGWGVIEATGSMLKYIDSGSVEIPKGKLFSTRLENIYRSLIGVTDKYSPEQAAIEDIFFCKNAKSALVLGHARGVALLALKNGGCENVFQYSPRKIKMSVVGVGSAEKRQVQHMVKLILGLKKTFKREDESDALATAICHANNTGRVTKDIKLL
ncbi:MAG: crossover junction endodeoxyribonuclease RuvC [Candidatus Aureabacteria bacterium]|nr:crossover junction endodeoxyribonuclease RuvC [Candidatus Auribacterota bacterium]